MFAPAPVSSVRRTDSLKLTKVGGERFAESVDAHFPGTVPEAKFLASACSALASKGFTKDSCIACANVCRDEKCGHFLSVLRGLMGPVFDMRSLGGFFTCGKTGFGAAHAHSPVSADGREKYVYFVAPHIAVDKQGAVAPVTRPGREKMSTACGALCALKAQLGKGALATALDGDDLEMAVIRRMIAPHAASSGGELDLVELTKLAEKVIVEEQLTKLVAATVDTSMADYAIVAGIQVHGPNDEDFFFPCPEHCITCVNGVQEPLIIPDEEPSWFFSCVSSN